MNRATASEKRLNDVDRSPLLHFRATSGVKLIPHFLSGSATKGDENGPHVLC